MAEPATTVLGRIFISYRREETAFAAGWLFDRLADRFGKGQIFKDVDNLQPGDDFVDVIAAAVGSCDVLLALIGPQWLTITDEHGQRRLDNPGDFVRLEIEAALARKVLVIPILVEGATMPGGDELPDSLARLGRRHALELNPSQFDFDTSRLLRVLDRTLAGAQVRPGTKAPPKIAAPPARPRPDSDPSDRSASTSRPAPGRPPTAPPVAAGRPATTFRRATPTLSEPSRPSGQAGKATRPTGRGPRVVLLLSVLVLLAAGVMTAISLRSGQARDVAVGERFAATSPWRLHVRGYNCGVRLADGAAEGYGSDFDLQVRATGTFSLSALTDGCTASVLPGAGKVVDLPLTLNAGADGTGGDTPPFHSAGGFRVTVTGTSCQTGIHTSLEGSEVGRFAGSEDMPINQSGDFYVRTDAHCSTTIEEL
jgi:TIR domain